MNMKIVANEKGWAVLKKNAWTGKFTETQFRTKEEATKYVRAQEKEREIERQILNRKIIRQANRNISVVRLMRMYFDFNFINKNTKTQSGYHASQVVECFGQRAARNITPEDIENFMEVQRRRGCSQITINRRVAILKTAIAWAVKQKIFEENHLASVQLPRAATKKIQPPTPEELEKMLSVAPQQVFRTILIGFHTGARVGPSELFRLEWRHVDFLNGIINLPCAEKNHNITTRVIPINNELMPYLQEWKRRDERVDMSWIIHYGGKPIRTLGRAWKNTLENAGITRNIRPYDLRHAYATYALAHGADLKTVAEIMGHTDATMILKTYQHVQPEMKRKAIDIMPSICSSLPN